MVRKAEAKTFLPPVLGGRSYGTGLRGAVGGGVSPAALRCHLPGTEAFLLEAGEERGIQSGSKRGSTMGLRPHKFYVWPANPPRQH